MVTMTLRAPFCTKNRASWTPKIAFSDHDFLVDSAALYTETDAGRLEKARA